VEIRKKQYQNINCIY